MVQWLSSEAKNIYPDKVYSVDTSDSEDEYKTSHKKGKVNALESKIERVDMLAKELQEKHKTKYTKIQYKLWAEALDVKRHTSKDVPPPGPIWDSQQPKGLKSVDAMASAFTQMANTVVSALSM